MLSQAGTDAVTTVTCLAGAMAGVASDQLATYAIDLVAGGSKNRGVGEMGLEFAARAFTSALAYNAVASYMPNTADNVAFGMLFFAAQPQLVNTGVAIANRIIRPMMAMAPSTAMPYRHLYHPSTSTVPGKKSDVMGSCATGNCGKACCNHNRY